MPGNEVDNDNDGLLNSMDIDDDNDGVLDIGKGKNACSLKPT